MMMRRRRSGWAARAGRLPGLPFQTQTAGRMTCCRVRTGSAHRDIGNAKLNTSAERACGAKAMWGTPHARAQRDDVSTGLNARVRDRSRRAPAAAARLGPDRAPQRQRGAPLRQAGAAGAPPQPLLPAARRWLGARGWRGAPP
jgi:hypothetical protein